MWSSNTAFIDQIRLHVSKGQNCYRKPTARPHESVTGLMETYDEHASWHDSLRSFTTLCLLRDYIYSPAIRSLNDAINASFTAADTEAPLVVRHSSCINHLMTMASGRQPHSMQTMTV